MSKNENDIHLLRQRTLRQRELDQIALKRIKKKAEDYQKHKTHKSPAEFNQ